VRLDGKVAVGSRHTIALSGHPPDFRRKGGLRSSISDVLDHGVREDPIERSVLKRQRAPIGDHQTDVHLGQIRAIAHAEIRDRNALELPIEGSELTVDSKAASHIQECAGIVPQHSAQQLTLTSPQLLVNRQDSGLNGAL
jgi:hypothetical protein